MAAELSVVGKYFGDKIVRQLIGYIEKDPVKNFDNLLVLAEKLAPLEDHKRKVRAVRTNFEQNPAIRRYIQRLLTYTHPNLKKRLLVNFFVNASIIGIPRQRRLASELGAEIPWAILIDPTSACNLRCVGCWAGKYERHYTMDFELLDRIVREAKELGIYFIAMSGGEPTLYKRLFELTSKHPDVVFMLYTNGTMIDDEMADKMVESGNVSPAISIEGGRERTDARRGSGVFQKIMDAMDRLRARGAIFGFSVTITSENAYEVYGDEFIDMMIDKGASYGWSFHYIPIGSEPNFDLMVTPEQRAWLADRVIEIRRTKPIQIADFWNDGELTGGCIAGGRRYFHITASGDVEPCAFIHFALDNIKNKSLREVLTSPLFKAYQSRQPFSENLLRPCPLIDVPHALRDIISESGARPTHLGADASLVSPHSDELDRRAENWRQRADIIWEQRERSRSREEKAESVVAQ